MKRTVLLISIALAWPLPTDSQEFLDPIDRGSEISDYRIGSRPDESALGGYARARNLPRTATNPLLGQEGELSLVAIPEAVVHYDGLLTGIILRLINRTGEEVAFRASDSRLPIVQEALDPEGLWRPVESQHWSFCGNSAHRVFLPTGQYWQFNAPRYTGTMQTHLRFVLRSPEPLHSNEFEGSIDPEQFNRHSLGSVIVRW